jgi:hypothetical protein
MVGQAIEKNLYSTHIKFESVGGFLFNIFFYTNLFVIFLVVFSVIIMSLIFFKKINTSFSGLDKIILKLSRADFSESLPQKKGLWGIENLSLKLENVRIFLKNENNSLSTLLKEIENGKKDPDLLKESLVKLEGFIK